jgi:hypothetical protein
MRAARAVNDAMEAELCDPIDRLADEYRQRCLWHFAPDFRVRGLDAVHELQARLVLDTIELYGDRAAFLRCR